MTIRIYHSIDTRWYQKSYNPSKPRPVLLNSFRPIFGVRFCRLTHLSLHLSYKRRPGHNKNNNKHNPFLDWRAYHQDKTERDRVREHCFCSKVSTKKKNVPRSKFGFVEWRHSKISDISLPPNQPNKGKTFFEYGCNTEKVGQ